MLYISCSIQMSLAPSRARPSPDLHPTHLNPPPQSYWLRPGFVVSTANVGAPLQFLPKFPKL